jgi:predicted RNase H-like HicB family nuclease
MVLPQGSESHARQGATDGANMRYAVVIEKAKRNYSAYIPDVPGCIATGRTVQQTLSSLPEALEFHFEGMREDGERIPDPETLVDYVDVFIGG